MSDSPPTHAPPTITVEEVLDKIIQHPQKHRLGPARKNTRLSTNALTPMQQTFF